MRSIIAFILILQGFFSSAQKDITVYVFMAEECPVCNYVAKSLSITSDTYQDQVKFVAVFPQRISNIKTASLFKKKYGLSHFIVEIDKDHSITNRLNGTVTPEVLVVDQNENILYQGRINNSYASPGRMKHGKVKEDLRDNLKKILEGKKISKPWPEPIGCYITRKNG